jgi:hypothetical protein
MLPNEGTTTVTEVPKLLEHAKLSFVLALRQAFASSFAHADLRYTQDANTKIKIYTAHPMVMEFLPSLVVSAAGGDVSFGYLQDDFAGESTDHNLQKYSGKVVFNMNITIYASKTVERERLVDHIVFFVRHLFRDVFNSFNIVYTRDITLGSENLSEVDNQPLYDQTISIPCYMEYNVAVDQSKLEEVRRVILSSVDYAEGIDLADIDLPQNADKVKTINF